MPGYQQKGKRGAIEVEWFFGFGLVGVGSMRLSTGEWDLCYWYPFAPVKAGLPLLLHLHHCHHHHTRHPHPLLLHLPPCCHHQDYRHCHPLLLHIPLFHHHKDGGGPIQMGVDQMDRYACRYSIYPRIIARSRNKTKQKTSGEKLKLNK